MVKIFVCFARFTVKPFRMNESLRLKDQPASERPRERLVARGPDALTHAELIAILLRTGLKGVNVVQVGQTSSAKIRFVECARFGIGGRDQKKFPASGMTRRRR